MQTGTRSSQAKQVLHCAKFHGTDNYSSGLNAELLDLVAPTLFLWEVRTDTDLCNYVKLCFHTAHFYDAHNNCRPF